MSKLDLCDINQLHRIFPLYAFINTHPTMESAQGYADGALVFFEYALGRRKISPFVCVSTPTNILITLRRHESPAHVKERRIFVRQRRQPHIAPGWLSVFMTAGIPRLYFGHRAYSLLDHTPGSGYRADVWRGMSYIVTNEHRRRNCGYVTAIRQRMLIDRNGWQFVMHPR